MPLPRWLARFNRRFINPRAITDERWGVLRHIGRKSGHTYETPLDVTPVDGGFLFFVIYGSRTDWLRNVEAAGRATLRYQGRSIELVSPRVVGSQEARSMAGEEAKFPPAWTGAQEFLVMDEVPGGTATVGGDG